MSTPWAYSIPEQPPPPANDACESCAHGFHGLTCNRPVANSKRCGCAGPWGAA